MQSTIRQPLIPVRWGQCIMVLSNHISTTVVKFGIPLVEASLTDYKNFTTNVLETLHNKCARIIMNFKDEPGQSQMALVN